MKPKSIQIKCDCGAESLEIIPGDEDDLFYVSIWRAPGGLQPLPWPDRLRYMWRILRTGRPYGDQLIFTKQSLKDLAAFIAAVVPDADSAATTINDRDDIIQRIKHWQKLSDSGLRLRCGEMTAQEIRTVRAILNNIY